MQFLFVLLQLGGGLAIFMFSIGMLSNTLKKTASARLKSILQKATGNPIKGALTGALVTFVVQSSSVTVLLLLGLVNAGIMNLRQSIYVILGSEIGTTITAQIVAFNVKMFFYPLIITGFAMKSGCSKEKLINVGEIFLYLGMIFLSMKIMTDGSSTLKDYPLVIQLLADFGVYPLLGIVAGALLTAITNSSSTTTSLVIAMGIEGVIPLNSGIALVIGANIGTCVLELIAIIGTNTAAKRTGVAQFIINVFGALIFFPFIEQFATLISYTATDTARLIANAHSIFNISVSLILLPFVGVLVSVLKVLIPGREEISVSGQGRIEDKFLAVPALALYEAEQEVVRMAFLVSESLKNAKMAFFENDEHAIKRVDQSEQNVDILYSNISTYLNKISTITLSEKDRTTKRALLHIIHDLERISDLAENIAGYSVHDKFYFSDIAKKDLAHFFDNAVQVYKAAANSLKKKGEIFAGDIRAMEHEARELKSAYRNKYILTLRDQEAGLTVDAMYPAVLKDVGRISVHSNTFAEHVLKIR